MTPQPKRRMSRARSGQRRATIKFTAPSLAACPNCGKMKLPHTVCLECGMYRGRLVVAPKVKATVKKLTPNEETPTSTDTPK